MRVSERTMRNIEILFSPAERAAAEEVLAGVSPSNVASLERIHAAALRLSLGDLAKLREIVRHDWRDVLTGAGFGSDGRAHESWVPQLLSLEVVRTWARNGEIARVEFRHREAAEIGRGRLPPEPCVVVALKALEPEVRYSVECSTGETITIPQSWLRHVRQ